MHGWNPWVQLMYAANRPPVYQLSFFNVKYNNNYPFIYCPVLRHVSSLTMFSGISLLYFFFSVSSMWSLKPGWLLDFSWFLPDRSLCAHDVFMLAVVHEMLLLDSPTWGLLSGERRRKRRAVGRRSTKSIIVIFRTESCDDDSFQSLLVFCCNILFDESVQFRGNFLCAVTALRSQEILGNAFLSVYVP